MTKEEIIFKEAKASAKFMIGIMAMLMILTNAILGGLFWYFMHKSAESYSEIEYNVDQDGMNNNQEVGNATNK